MSTGIKTRGRAWGMRRWWLHRWLRRVGLWLEEESELQPGYELVGTAHLPAWAMSPTAGIAGEWHVLRKRWRWLGIQVTPWREVGRS
jgi:hypothetical protein